MLPTLSAFALLHERADLIAKAIKACETLNGILHELLSKPYRRPDGETTLIWQENRRLEQDLVGTLCVAAERRNGIISPFYHLSEDIVRQIFELATDAELSFTRGTEHRYQPQAPIRLSHVCRRWRAIALDSPRLWRIVNLAGHGRSFSSTIRNIAPETIAARLPAENALSKRDAAFVDRAKSVPLQVALDVISNGPNNLVMGDTLLELCSNRIEELCLSVWPEPQVIPKMLSYLSLTSPRTPYARARHTQFYHSSGQ